MDNENPEFHDSIMSLIPKFTDQYERHPSLPSLWPESNTNSELDANSTTKLTFPNFRFKNFQYPKA